MKQATRLAIFKIMTSKEQKQIVADLVFEEDALRKQLVCLEARPYTMGWFVDRIEATQPKPNRPSAYRPHQKAA